MNFQGCAAKDDWSRFDEYAKRVHVISLAEDYNIRFPHYLRDVDQASVFLHDISTTRPSVALFPNLHTLRFVAIGPRTKILLPVSLRRLHIDITDDEDAVDVYMEVIFQ